MFMYVGVFAYIYLTYVQCPERPEEGIGSLETGTTDGCEPLCGSWEWNLGPQERTARALNCCAISLASNLLVF